MTAPTKPTETPDGLAGQSVGAATGSAAWSKAEIHFWMAKAAWKLAARNEHGAAMVIEHMERAVETLKAMTPNVRTQRPGDAEATNATRATPPGSLE